VLRAVDESLEKLELVSFEWVKGSSFVPGKMEIPDSKSFSEWIGQSPDSTIGAISSDMGTCCNPVFRNECEQLFIDWIGFKSWFPVTFNEQTFVFVLLREKGASNFRFDEITFTWLLTQSKLCVASNGTIQDHHRFHSVMSVFEDFVQAKYPSLDHFFQSLLYLISSGSGLGWNRVALFRFDTPNSMRCVGATGEANKRIWLEKLEHRSLPSLKVGLEEIQASFHLDENSFSRITQGLVVDVNEEPALDCVNGCSWIIDLPKPLNEDLSRNINQSFASALSEFEPSQRNFGTIVQIGGERYMLVLSQPYSADDHASMQITFVLFLNLLLSMTRARIGVHDNRTSDESLSEEDAQQLLETLNKVRALELLV
jgi:hypothetical protein